MPEKEGAEEKSTKSVVNKKQKQMMGEEGYDHLRDQGRIRKRKHLLMIYYQDQNQYMLKKLWML